jgi:NADH-quinone oxidoreductase subunit K
MVGPEAFLWLSLGLFLIGTLGFLTRRSIIIMLISIELQLNAVNLLLVSLSHYLQDPRGQVLVLFVITVAAAEAAIGLAILMALFRLKAAAHVEQIKEMRG